MWWFASPPLSRQVPGFESTVWSLQVLPVSVWILSEYSNFLSQSKYIRLRGDSRLGVDVSANGCLSVCVRQIDDHFRASINKTIIKSFTIIITAIIIAPIFIPMSI